MSNNIYDILGKLDGLTPKANPVSTSEPIYESVDPRGDIMSAVTQLEERFMGFKEAKAKKRKEPSVEVPADDLTRSADPDVVKLATKARFAKPQAKNDFEAIVSYVSKQEKELERAEQADILDREKIEKTQGMLAKTQANQDALRKVIDNTDQRFRALNAKVASGQVTAQDQKAAQAAQQIEKDTDTAKAAVAKNATAPEQPTTAPEVPQDTNVYNFPDKQPEPDNTSDLENQPSPGSGNVPQQTQTWASLQNPDPTQARQTQAGLPDPGSVPNLFPEPKRVNQRENKTNEGFWKDKDIANQENPTAQAPQTPTTPEEFVAYNKAQVARLESEPNLPSVLLVYPDGQIIMSRATHEKVARGLSKVSDKILKNRVETDIYSHRDQLSKYINDIESAPGVDYYYFYNVKRGQEAKAFNIGLKQSKGGNWYNPRVPLPAADEIFGKGVKWTPGQPAQTTAESVEESLGKNTMTKPTSIIEAVRSVEDKKLREAAKPDFLDLDKDGDTDEPMKSAAKSAKDHEPAEVDSDAVAKRKRLQALKDKQEDERAEKGDYDSKSSTRVVKGRAYGGAAQKDDEDKDELEESAKPDFLDVDKDGDKKEPFKKAVKDKKEVEEGTNFGDTIKNSKGKMTKVTVKEGKDAIRNHPIYTTKEAWDHYAEELAEQETMEQAVLTPVIDVQQELDEIAKLAGLPVKTCEACDCSPCKCNENLAPMAPADSASPLTYTELDEAATRKDFRMVADLIKANPDREKAKELANHHGDIFKQQNPRFKREMFLAACGLDECGSMPTAVVVGEADMEEGNEFSGALAAAKASGSKDFEVDGKKYTVKEDININVTASGEEDAVNLIRKLSGMPVIAIQAAPAEEACGACGSSPCGCEETVAEAGPKERDIEYTNTPREETAEIDAAIPDGGDLNRAKKQYRKEYPGDNPMAVKEAIQNMLWNDYQSMIDDVKA